MELATLIVQTISATGILGAAIASAYSASQTRRAVLDQTKPRLEFFEGKGLVHDNDSGTFRFYVVNSGKGPLLELRLGGGLKMKGDYEVNNRNLHPDSDAEVKMYGDRIRGCFSLPMQLRFEYEDEHGRTFVVTSQLEYNEETNNFSVDHGFKPRGQRKRGFLELARSMLKW